MKNKWKLVSSVIQILIGIIAVISYIIVWRSGENYKDYMGAVLLAVGFIIIGLIGLFDNKSSK